MEKYEFIKELQKLAESVNPLEMVNHAKNCQSCQILLNACNIVINAHMEDKRK